MGCFCTGKITGKRKRKRKTPEAKHIQITNSRARSLVKTKLDIIGYCVVVFFLQHIVGYCNFLQYINAYCVFYNTLEVTVIFYKTLLITVTLTVLTLLQF